MIKEIKDLAKSSLIYGFGGIAGKIIGFILIPLYTAHLSPEDYGIMSLISVTITIISVIALMEMRGAMSIEYFHVENETDKRNVIKTCYLWVIIVSFLLSGIVFLFSKPLSLLLFSDLKSYTLIRLASISLFFSTSIIVPINILRILQRPMMFTIFSLVNLIVAAIFNIIFIAHLKRGVLGFFEAQVLSYGIIFLFSVIFIVVPHIKGASFVYKKIPLLLKLGMPGIPVGLGGWALTYIDRFFLNHYTGLYEVGIYTLGYKFGLIMQILFVNVIRYAWQIFAYSTMKNKDARVFYARGTTYFVIWGVFTAVLMGGLSREVIMLLARKSAYWAAHEIVFLISVSYFLYGLYFILNVVLGIVKKTYYMIPVIFTAVICNIILNFLLIPRFGVIGAAWATAIAYLLSTIMMYSIAQKIYVIRYEWSRLIKVFLVGIIVYLLSKLISFEPLLLCAIVKLLIILVGYTIGLLIFGFLNRTEQKYIHEWGNTNKTRNAIASLVLLPNRLLDSKIL